MDEGNVNDWLRHGWPDLKKAREDQDALRARMAGLEAALTPSAETKAAYIGEFGFQLSIGDESDEDFSMTTVLVPWTCIKEIMTTIRARAALAPSTKAQEEPKP